MLRTKRSAISRSQKANLSTGAVAHRLRQLAIDADTRAEAASEPQRGETLWRAIAHAEWTPVDAFEARGRRFLIAKSPTSSANCVAIETLDRVILSSRATGTSLKVIASDLGVSITTVARRLRSAMRQLGLLNAADLTAVFGPGAP